MKLDYQRKINKRGMLRTLEAVLAFILTFTFLVFITKPLIPIDHAVEPLSVLKFLENDDAFRRCVFVDDEECISSIIGEYIPGSYEFTAVIITPYFPPEDQEVIIESLFLASEQTKVYKTVKLYYWETLNR